MTINAIIQHEGRAHRRMTNGNEPTVVVGFSILIPPSERRRVLQDLPTDNPILDAAKRELAPRAQATAPLRTANDAYDGAAYITSIDTSAHKGTRKTPVAGGHDTAIEQFGLVSDAHAGDNIGVIKLGDGTCSFTPAQALNEVGQARRNGTL